MKGYLMLIGMMISLNLWSQSKQDYQWFFGNDQDGGQEGVQGLRMNFNVSSLNVAQATNGLSFDQNNTSISDEEGNVLFYTNGCAIANSNHEVMMNGDSINWGNFLEYFWEGGDCSYGYPGRQDIMILPDPGYEQGYYLIHKPEEFNYDTDFDIYLKFMKYSYVDMSLDNGLGAVTTKNETFYTSDGNMIWSYLTAIRHVNKKDWWIIQPDAGTEDQFLVFLIDDSGITLDHIEPISFLFIENTSASGKAKFSPDGNLYSFFSKYHGLRIYNFDRSDGHLSDERVLSVPYPEQATFSDLEFSSNSELIYISTTDSLWQVDLTLDNLKDGKVLIDVPNGYGDPLPTSFFDLSLAPDCKIYIRSGSSVKTFDVIHKPNERGLACDFVQQAVSFPQFTSVGTFPNFPRFRVDEDEKCDPTITSFLGDQVYYRRDLQIFPNPVQDQLNITIPEQQSGQVIIYDIEGRILIGPIAVGNQSDIHQVDVSTLATGTYIVEYVSDDRKERLVYNQKFVKI